MKVELELPAELVAGLYRESESRDIYQCLSDRSLGTNGPLNSRPDWQAALLRSRDWAAGRTVGHQEVEAWHNRRLD
jgi:hypothetical protein